MTLVEFASAISTHPVASIAVGEVCGAILEKMNCEIDFALIATTPTNLGILEDIARAVQEVLRPLRSAAVCSQLVPGNATESAPGPTISLWCSSGSTHIAPIHLSHQKLTPTGESNCLDESELGFVPRTALVIADNATFNYLKFANIVKQRLPTMDITGGYITPAANPVLPSLWLGTSPLHEGALCIVIGQDIATETISVSSCSQLGPPLVVTKSSNNEIHQIAGQRASDRLRIISQLTSLSVDHDSIEIGLLHETTGSHYRDEDFIARPIIGINPSDGSITTTQHVPVGTVVSFQKRSQSTANSRLSNRLTKSEGRAAITFSSSNQTFDSLGNRFISARLVEEALGSIPLIGISVLGEFGQINYDNVVHNFTDTTVLFK